MSVPAELRPPATLFLVMVATCAALLLAAVTLAAYASDAGTGERVAKVNPEGYTDSRVCGACHVDIYRSWKNSMHAFALSDPIFDAAYMQALKIAGDEAKPLCLRCHAPLTQVNGDFELALGITREGVTCDFCHTVTAVHLDRGERPFSLAPGLTKRSVLKKADSPAHDVAYSELHGKAEFCGGCHNYTTPAGATLMSTYDEWRLGPYAKEGVQCQHCHMVLSPGRVARVGRESTGTNFHLHDLIHDSEQLQGALSLEIVRAHRTERGLEVHVAVENESSGHSVPTGVPTREVVLSVTAESGRHSRTLERRYRKLVGDAEGKVLTSDAEAFIHGASVLDDNRIKPRERRRERFVFSLPSSGKATVSARLSYVYSPMILKRQELNVKLAEVERTIH